jgi:hypothetical protein
MRYIIAALLFLQLGCVSLNKYRLIEFDRDLYKKAYVECSESLRKCRNDVQAKTDRLRYFNQVNSDGSLR